MPADEPDWLERAMTLGGALPLTLVSRTAASTIHASGRRNSRRRRHCQCAQRSPKSGRRPSGPPTACVCSTRNSPNAPPASRRRVHRFFRFRPLGRAGAWAFSSIPWRAAILRPHGFGHDGAGGQVAFAEPELGLGFAYLTNLMEGARRHARDDPSSMPSVGAFGCRNFSRGYAHDRSTVRNGVPCRR